MHRSGERERTELAAQSSSEWKRLAKRERGEQKEERKPEYSVLTEEEEY